ncbi:hypothetical protein ACRSLK_12490 [Halopseudomonas pachastrellae]|uniref:hypothetical protein n=1 Tax=Halopseudomonas pachastrellae TaxID=254161 RepID=UPI003D7DCAF0
MVLAVLAGALVVGALGVLVVVLRAGTEVTAGALVTGAGREGVLGAGALATRAGALDPLARLIRWPG